MAALPFVGTLDSDEEVQQVDDETESEDEQTKVNLVENWLFSLGNPLIIFVWFLAREESEEKEEG